MKRSVRLWMAVVTFIAVMFSSTVCYGAESSGGEAAEAESGAVTRSINTQSASTTLPVDLDCDEITVRLYVEMTYSWDEGYAGWFDAGGISTPDPVAGHSVVLRPCIVDIKGSYIIFDIYVSVDDIWYHGTATFYVDEYGVVS